MIEIKPFEENDFSSLINWISCKGDLHQFAGNIFTFPLTKEQLHGYLKDSNRSAFKVIHKLDNAVIGHSEIYITKDNTAKICRVLLGELKYRGKGLGKALVEELVRISFEKHNVASVELNVYDWNVAALNCYLKVGFSAVEELTKTTEVNGEVWTTINMILTRKDWILRK